MKNKSDGSVWRYAALGFLVVALIFGVMLANEIIVAVTTKKTGAALLIVYSVMLVYSLIMALFFRYKFGGVLSRARSIVCRENPNPDSAAQEASAGSPVAPPSLFRRGAGFIDKVLHPANAIAADCAGMSPAEKQKLIIAFLTGFFLPMPCSFFVIPYCLRRKGTIYKVVTVLSIVALLAFIRVAVMIYQDISHFANR